MNKLIFFLLIVILSSCRKISINEDVLILSKSDYELYYFTSSLKTVTESITDSIIYKSIEFWHSTSKEDDRPYSFKICRTDNTLNDTIMLITVNPNNRTYEFGSFESFTLVQYYRNESENLGKNYPNRIEFTNYLKSIQSNNYYELIPSQECIEIPIQE